MTLSNDNTPSRDGRGENNPEKADAGDLVFPSAPRAFHNRILYTAYLENCRNGFEGRNDLVTSTYEMTYEDQMVFQKMGDYFRDVFSRKLRLFQMADIESDLTVRMLHPVLARGEGHSEYHLYVDVVNKDGRAVLPDYEALDVFQNGPASLQMYAHEEDGRVSLRDVLRLISTPAFQEATQKLMSASWEEIADRPRSFIAFGWILHGLVASRQAAARRRGEPAEVIEKKYGFHLSDMKDFQWTGEKRPPTFEFSLQGVFYRVSILLDRATKRPTLHIHEDAS